MAKTILVFLPAALVAPTPVQEIVRKGRDIKVKTGAKWRRVKGSRS